MKIKLDYFFNFVKNNPAHFSALDPEIAKLYDMNISFCSSGYVIWKTRNGWQFNWILFKY